ncbi:hypothetical protein L484_016945 [Morus notabilis]|uniref:Uncharacterized protein n=1 Tax=Morus notabilis TaxID=981085 RepID=W9QFU0_9ROSA|nr:hypothetical protein L484_016945 [Morus notabilis]
MGQSHLKLRRRGRRKIGAVAGGGWAGKRINDTKSSVSKISCVPSSSTLVSSNKLCYVSIAEEFSAEENQEAQRLGLISSKSWEQISLINKI